MIVMFSLSRYIPEYKEYADDIGFYIQRFGGALAIRKHEVEFTIEERYREFVLIKYPFLEQVLLVY